jgi:hypothetical protein
LVASIREVAQTPIGSRDTAPDSCNFKAAQRAEFSSASAERTADLRFCATGILSSRSCTTWFQNLWSETCYVSRTFFCVWVIDDYEPVCAKSATNCSNGHNCPHSRRKIDVSKCLQARPVNAPAAWQHPPRLSF